MITCYGLGDCQALLHIVCSEYVRLDCCDSVFVRVLYSGVRRCEDSTASPPVTKPPPEALTAPTKKTGEEQTKPSLPVSKEAPERSCCCEGHVNHSLLDPRDTDRPNAAPTAISFQCGYRLFALHTFTKGVKGHATPSL